MQCFVVNALLERSLRRCSPEVDPLVTLDGVRVMEKLRLDLNAVAVESFATTAGEAASALRGTVEGRENPTLGECATLPVVCPTTHPTCDLTDDTFQNCLAAEPAHRLSIPGG